MLITTQLSPYKDTNKYFNQSSSNEKQNNISFGGFGEGRLAQKLAKSDSFKNILIGANKNTLAIEAAYALLITCALRPAITLLTPAKDQDEKDKNKFRAAHAIASGAIGYLFTVCLAHPISDAVDKIMNTKLPDGSLKYMKKYTDQLSVNGGNTFKEIAKRIHQPVFMPLRAMATVAIVPTILGLFGIRKKSKVDPKPDEQLQNQKIFNNNAPEVFKNIEGGNNAN